MSARDVLVRTTAAVGVAAGLLLLTRPEQALTRLAPEYPSERRWAVRLLGGRLLAQHLAVLAVPRPAVLRLAAGVDLLHAATMLPLVRSPRYGRAARVSGGVAAACGVWESLASGHPRGRRGGMDARRASLGRT